MMMMMNHFEVACLVMEGRTNLMGYDFDDDDDDDDTNLISSSQ